MRIEEITGPQMGSRVFWGGIFQIECDIKSRGEQIKERFLKVTNTSHPPCLKLHRFISNFRKNQANYGVKVEICLFFRKQNVRTSEKVLLTQEQ